MATQTKNKAPKGQKTEFQDIVYPTIYSNIMGVGATPFDISIVFGEVSDRNTPELLTAIPRTKVVLAPEQAANLIHMLGGILRQYVEANGKLRRGGAMTGVIDMKELREGDEISS